MPLDPSLSLKLQPLQVPSEANALAKLQQFRQGQQAEQLNALRMQGAQQEMDNAKIDRAMKTYSDLIARAPNKESAGRVVSQMFNDPVVGSHWQRFGTAEQAVNDIPSDDAGFSRWKMMFGGATPLQIENLDVQRGSLEARKRENELRQQQQAAEHYDKTGQLLPGYGGAQLSAPVEGAGLQGTIPSPNVGMTTTPSEGMPGGRGIVPPATQRAIDKTVAIEKAKTAAKADQPLTPLQEDKMRTTIGKDRKAAVTSIDAMDDVLSSIGDLYKSEETGGLSRATGYMSYAPSLPNSEAALAETRIANLKGKVTALGKAVQASSGAIGSIATQEWKILRDTVSGLDEAIARGDKPTLEEIKKIEDYALRARENIRDAYAKTHGDSLGRFPDLELPELVSPKPASSSKPKPTDDFSDVDALTNYKGK